MLFKKSSTVSVATGVTRGGSDTAVVDVDGKDAVMTGGADEVANVPLGLRVARTALRARSSCRRCASMSCRFGSESALKDDWDVEADGECAEVVGEDTEGPPCATLGFAGKDGWLREGRRVIASWRDDVVSLRGRKAVGGGIVVDPFLLSG